MPETIKVLLVDDSYQVRQSVKAMLEFEVGQFTVIGEAENGQEAIEKSAQLRPDVVLMDVNMPVMDGIAATQRMMQEAPVGVVIISVQGEQEYLRRAMKAGARDYLIKPFTCDELVTALRSAAATGPHPTVRATATAPKRMGKVLTIFSTKGGVGKTTIAVNVATALSQGGPCKVAALDLDLEFGVLATMMGVRPQATIVDLCRLSTPITPDHTERVLARHGQSGVGVLAACPLPYLAPEVDGEGRADRSRSYVTEIIEALRATHDFVVIDTSASFREANLVAFDKSDLILMVAQPEIPTLESTAKGLDILLERLEYPREKVHVILNRAENGAGLTQADIAESLGVSLSFVIPVDSQEATAAANTGIPAVLKRAKGGPIAQAISQMAAQIIAEGSLKAESRAPAKKPSLSLVAGARRLFGIL